MHGLTIHKTSLPRRCEICHQADKFTPESGVCLRCSALEFPNADSQRYVKPLILPWFIAFISVCCCFVSGFLVFELPVTARDGFFFAVTTFGIVLGGFGALYVPLRIGGVGQFKAACSDTPKSSVTAGGLCLVGAGINGFQLLLFVLGKSCC